jgi:Kef-type K+ transport system membrane component KefB
MGSIFDGVLAQAPLSAALKPGQVLAFVLFDITLILVMARLMGFLAAKVGQPRVVGEIIAGVLLGPTLFGATLFALNNPPAFLSCEAALTLNGASPTLTACLFPPQAASIIGNLGQLALVFFMFLVGLELDFGVLKGKEKGIVLVSIGVVAVPVALGFLVGPIMFNDTFAAEGASKTGFTLMVGAMLSVTAFPVMARILQEKNLTKTDMGAIGVAAAAVVTVLMFVLVGVAAGVASGASTTKLLTQVGLALVYVVVMFAVVRPALAPLGRKYEQRAAARKEALVSMGWSERETARDTPGIGATLTTPMFAFIVIFTMASSWIAHILGINVIVGGFLAGAVLPARKGLVGDMTAELFDVTAVVLLPMFLAFSGLATDFTLLSASAIPGILIFLVAGIAGKWGAGAVFGKVGGLKWPEANAIGILMNCRGLLVLVVGIVALQAEVITPVMHVAGVLMALITTAMTGPLFDMVSKKFDTPAPAPAAAPASGGRPKTGAKPKPKARR